MLSTICSGALDEYEMPSFGSAASIWRRAASLMPFCAAMTGSRTFASASPAMGSGGRAPRAACTSAIVSSFGAALSVFGVLGAGGAAGGGVVAAHAPRVATRARGARRPREPKKRIGGVFLNCPPCRKEHPIGRAAFGAVSAREVSRRPR